MQNQSQLPGDQLTMKGSMNFAYAYASCHAACILPFIRCNFGTEGLGLSALGGFVILAFCFGLSAEPGMAYYIGAWVFAVALQRVQTYRNWITGNAGHSRYAGDSPIGWIIRNNMIARLVVEPVLVFGIGVAVGENSPMLAWFLQVGGGSLFVAQAFERMSIWHRARRMNDARVEAQVMAASSRGQRWDW